jgi:hypothetical protein
LSARLDAIAEQLRSTRKLAALLAVAVVALIAWSVYTNVRKPTTITLSSGDDWLELSPSVIEMHTGKTSFFVTKGGVSITDKDERAEQYGDTGVKVSNGKAHVWLTVGPRAALSLDTPEARADLIVAGGHASLDVLGAHHEVTLRADKDGAKLEGLGSAQAPPPAETPPAK